MKSTKLTIMVFASVFLMPLIFASCEYVEATKNPMMAAPPPPPDNTRPAGGNIVTDDMKAIQEEINRIKTEMETANSERFNALQQQITDLQATMDAMRAAETMPTTPKKNNGEDCIHNEDCLSGTCMSGACGPETPGSEGGTLERVVAEPYIVVPVAPTVKDASVSDNKTIRITFSEPMDLASLKRSVSVKLGETNIAGEINALVVVVQPTTKTAVSPTVIDFVANESFKVPVNPSDPYTLIVLGENENPALAATAKSGTKMVSTYKETFFCDVAGVGGPIPCVTTLRVAP